MPLDNFTAEGITSLLSEGSMFRRVEVYGEVGSTNTLVRERAAQGEPEGLVIAAERQTAGRGRKGRSFFSPDGTGLYISLLLRPQLSPEDTVAITTAAAVAAAEAVERLSGGQAGIKWVNDIHLGGLKVCGILTEAGFSSSGDRLDYAVLGAGFNVCPPDGGFPPELDGIAGSILPSLRENTRCELAAHFLTGFEKYYSTMIDGGYIEEYRRRSVAVGRRVSVISVSGSEPALVTGVDDKCRLLVRYDDGREGVLSSGEISIRL